MTTMPKDNKIRPRGGFVRFMRKLDNLNRKELKDGYADLLSTQERLGSELYQRYEGLLEWIAGERNWSDYISWVWDGRSSSERQANLYLRLSLGLDKPSDSMGMYNGDRSSTLGKAVEYILSNHQSQQQDDVSSGVTNSGSVTRSPYVNLDHIERLYYLYNGPSTYTSRSGQEPLCCQQLGRAT